MVIFHSYVKLPEGNGHNISQPSGGQGQSHDRRHRLAFRGGAVAWIAWSLEG